MQRKDDSSDDLLCSFCGKSQDEVKIRQAAPDLQVEVLAELRGAFMCRPGHPLLRRRGAPGFSAAAN